MEIVRYIDGKEIVGEMPKIKIENPGVLKIIRDLQNRIMQESEKENNAR